MEAAVSTEAVSQHLPRAASIASKFKGQAQAEYDDLFQECSEYIVRQLLNGKVPSGTGMRNACRSWVRKCREAGISHADPETI